ncbi:phosphoadenylyl-sulfate reductase [Aquabacterium sp. CECT 9606]|uniref:phosphoadenylyl-sulfate reductase n=1 Tax=Aquabacterium sp. CECT 9606 TaxID=2845822 RepID=UPI001E345CB8|nr:phosphoadenylyl-sulfate reductase [Aquabacterium sp. CECT 9606]CAH0355554.1 Thioredoxin-dependent 5'-adenylylsulfate reductase [Aquabacterium sp. CECT 9606]
MSAIALYAKASPDFEAKLAATVALLKAAAAEHPGKVVQATSLGVEDMIVTDLIARHHIAIAIGTLETGMLHPQTVAMIGTIESTYDLKVEVYQPVQEVTIEFVRKNGEKAMYESIDLRKACCGIRKLEPLSRMLASREAWITGLRREQSNNRGGMLAREEDDKGRAKYNPMIDWTWGDVWHYVSLNKVPYNPLHDEFMPSIGCAPCTRAIAVGEDFRAGRWWWEDEKAKECGLHVHEDNVAEELPPIVSSLIRPPN